MRKTDRVSRLITILLSFWTAGVALLVVGPVAAGGPPSDLALDLVASGFLSPVAARHAGDGSGRLFVVEQDGSIMIIDGGVVEPVPFLDISGQVDNAGHEQGLLGIAFHPQYASNGLFFVNYTYDPGPGLDRTRVSRFSVSGGNPNLADPTSELVILEVEQDFANHNGGDIHFGPDGYLYIGMGDGGSGGDPNNRAQDLTSLLGKMLRIDVDSGGLGNYGIPPGNPFVGNVNAADEIWAYGLRNPWRFSFDRFSGDLLIADVGQNAWEEINFQSAAGSGGENYGWSCMEGDAFPNFNACDGNPLTGPILTYGHGPECSVTGGYVYRGVIGGLQESYIFGDYCSGRIWFAAPSGAGWSATEWADTSLNISSFGEDEDGEIYVVDLGGSVYRFVSPTSVFSDAFESGDTSQWSAATGG
ncbi:MAG: sorbosone dehydrogenase family protein [Thermoanaerobaculales bacterium]